MDKKKRFFRLLRRLFYLYAAVVLVVGLFFSVGRQSTLSAVAAEYIDNTLPHKKLNFDERMSRGFKARCVSLFVYPVYAVADTCYLLPRAAYRYAEGIVYNQTQYYDAAWADAVLAKRSLVGFVSSPASLFSADFVTRHFVPSRPLEGKIESGGRFYFAEGNQSFPKTTSEIQKLVQFARETDRHVSIVGAGLSQGMQVLPCEPDDIVLNLKNFNKVDVDPASKTAVVQAGARWQDVQKAVNPHGLSVRVMQASNVFSVGGSLSVNCHGWDHRAGTLSNTVNSVTVVDAEGELRQLTPKDPEFAFVVGGFGLYGVIVEAEISLTDNNALIDTGTAVPLERYVQYFYEQVLADETIEMHLYRLSLDPENLLGEGVAQNYITDHVRGLALVSDLHDEAEIGRFMDRVGVHSARKYRQVRKKYWKKEKENIIQPVSITRNEVMRAPIKAMFNNSRHDSEWLQEFFVPGDELADYLKELGALLTRYEVCLLNATVRFVKQDSSSALGYNRGGDRFAVVLCFNQPLDEEREISHTQEWVQYAIDLTLRHGGTYYLPYQHFASPKQFNQAYPHFEEFVAAKKEYDPKEVFSSKFYELHAEYINKESEFSKNNEAIDAYDAFGLMLGDRQLRREFRKFLRNIFLNLNEDDFMKLAENQLQNTASRRELYKALEANLSDAQPGFLADSWRSLKALKGQKKALTKQLATLADPDASVNGYVEIGFPGRMAKPIADVFKVTGSTFVVHTEESLMDYLQCGFPRPYGFFVPLDDYAPLTESIDARSIDLVLCFIGLHHCPEEKLEAFVKSISDVLRSGGSFILRDHDAGTVEAKAMACLAHTTFNLGTGVPWDGLGQGLDEETEVRNFQGLDYWDELLARHGLVRERKKMPLFRPGDPTRNALVKYVKVETPQDHEKSIVEESLRDPEAERKQLQTFMTSVEWHSVRVAREYAAFIEHTPFYMYPYFDHIKAFWKLFRLSWSEARRYHSIWEIASSDYFVMNAFIAGFHTIEFAFKGAISAPIAAFYQADDNAEPDTIRLVVLDPDRRIDTFGERGVKVVNLAAQNPSMQDIEMPRYTKFRDLLTEMIKEGIEVVSIAGQKRVQLQCTLPIDKLPLVKKIPGGRLIGSLNFPLDPSMSIAYLNVDVTKLHTILPDLRSQGIQVDYIHDF